MRILSHGGAASGSGNLAQRWRERPPPRLRRGRRRDFKPPHLAAEVFVQRVKAIRLQFPKNSSQFLLYPVDSMKKSAAIDPHLAAAKLPVGSQKEVKTKYFMLELVQRAPAYQAEIGDIILVSPHPGELAVLSGAEGQRYSTHVLLLARAIAKTRVASAKDRS